MVSTDAGMGHPTMARARSLKRKYVVGGVLVVAAIIYLVITAARGSTEYYMTVGELHAQGPSPRQVRVSGNVLKDSIAWSPRDLRLEFRVTDDSGILSVVHHGARPDMFRDGTQVVLEGRYGNSGVFEADSMLLKCPSKYEEAGADG